MDNFLPITKDIEYKLHQIREDAFLRFKDFIYQHGSEEMKNYSKKQLIEIFYNLNYSTIVLSYDEDDGLEYQCMYNSL